MAIQMCKRCGLLHPVNNCKATLAKCYNCNKCGHYARNCYFKGKSSIYTELKKLRDRERMTTFIRVKNFQNLPFYGIETEELLKLFPKNYLINVGHLTIARGAECKLEETKQKLEESQKTISNLQNENRLLNQKQTQHEDLTSELHGIIENADMEIKKITKQRDELFKYLRDLIGYVLKLDKVFKQTKLELQGVLNFSYCNVQDPAVNYRIKNFRCKRCGSNGFHKSSDCRAKGIKCMICEKLNHFTGTCKKQLTPTVISDYVINLLPKLECEINAKDAACQR